MRLVLHIHGDATASVDPAKVADWVRDDRVLRRAFREVVVWPAPRSDDHDVTVCCQYSELLSGWLGVTFAGPHVPGDIRFELDADDEEALQEQLVEGLRRCAWEGDPEASIERRVAVAIEHLVHEFRTALTDENAQLRRELEAAQLRVGFLEDQLAALNEAKATGRKRIMVAAIAMVTAIVTGASEGAVSRIVQPGTGPSAEHFVERCDEVRIIIEQLPEVPPGREGREQ